MNLLQLQSEGPRLVAAHPHLLKQAPAERRRKQRHAFTLNADQRYVAELCLSQTCKVLNITRTAILGRRRIQWVVDYRHVAMTVAYELSGLSTIVLGNLFRRGHTMILWAQKRVNSDKALRAQADKVVGAVKRELRKR